MKIKTAAIALALITYSNGAVLLNVPYQSGAITSLVQQFEHGYLYTYTYDRSELQYSSQDLSHIIIFVCETFNPSNITTTGDVMIGNLDQKVGEFKFDDLSDNQPNTFSLSFESINTPHFGDMKLKYGSNTETINTIVPSCQIIPEIKSTTLGLIGVLLLRRRRPC